MQAIFRSEFKNTHNPIVYDLGCSVGAVIVALAQVMPITTEFVGIDNSADMLEQASLTISRQAIKNKITLENIDINQATINHCNAICLNYTLQFLAKEQRQVLLDKCFTALADDGIIFIAEKTLQDEKIINWHEQFKLNNGYSELEVAKKRAAIENVMKIDYEIDIIKRLEIAGFKEVHNVFSALSFKAWVAIKS